MFSVVQTLLLLERAHKSLPVRFEVILSPFLRKMAIEYFVPGKIIPFMCTSQ